MKKVILFAILILIVGGCANRGGNIQTTPLSCKNVGSGRGVTVDFINNAPPKEVTEGRKFAVSLKFANYNKDQMNVQYFVQDNVDVTGFNDQEGSVFVEGATINNQANAIYEPGCKLFGESEPSEKRLGAFSYTNVDYDDEINFIARIDYDYISIINGNFCLFNLNTADRSSCSETEVLQGVPRLGLGALYDPVTVTSVEKTLSPLEENNVLINLDISIENLGGGRIKTEDRETVNFRILSDDLSFDCISENILEGNKRGNNLRVYLQNKKADVNCQSEASIDRLALHTFTIELEYPYEYYVTTWPIKLINVKNG